MNLGVRDIQDVHISEDENFVDRNVANFKSRIVFIYQLVIILMGLSWVDFLENKKVSHVADNVFHRLLGLIR